MVLVLLMTRFLMHLGLHNSPLDGSDIQVETTKEQDKRKD